VISSPRILNDCGLPVTRDKSCMTVAPENRKTAGPA
jgi:hypothetical protein